MSTQLGAAVNAMGGLDEQANVDVYGAMPTPAYRLGMKYDDQFGRRFRYSKGGGAALVQAYMTQTGIVNTGYYSVIPQTAYPQVAGARKIRVLVVTGGLAAAAENDFAGGWLMCNKVSPAVLGDIYPIVYSNQPAETLVDLELATPIRNAWLATAELTLNYSKFFKTVAYAAAAATGQAVGVPLGPVPIGYYYWSQVRGPCPLMVGNGDTLTIGQPVGCAATLAAAGCAAARASTKDFWGIAISIATGDEPGLVDLRLE